MNDQALVDFWFSQQTSQYWFNSTPEFDQQLRESYADLWQQAQLGELDNWRETAIGSLALVILLDQIPLNIFRGKPESFVTEAQSIIVARAAIDKGFDDELTQRQKSFLYMPFMHSENLQDQAFALAVFDQPGLEDNFRFAKHHYALVEQFGRFPHRNEILGRQSSQAEIEYLNSKQAFKG
ncbi:MAG: hypothetical protein ACI9KN_001344 [Gammaproteobacteria bacterium]|jgi:uncharacterized protein (DUF924 family)